MRTLLSRSFSRLTDRNNVDLPQPEGPIRAVTLLRGMAIEMSCSACFAPYHRLKLSIVEHRLFLRNGGVRFGRNGLPFGNRRQPAGAGGGACRLRRMRQHAGFGDRWLLDGRFAARQRIRSG